MSSGKLIDVFYSKFNKFLIKSGYISLSQGEFKSHVIKLLIVLALVPSVVIFNRIYRFIGEDLLSMTLISVILVVTYPYLAVLNDFFRRRACLYNDLRFMLISSSIVAPTYDLIKMLLESFKWSSIYRCIAVDSLRLKTFTKWLTIYDALSMISEFSPSKKFKQTLLDYLDSLRRGTVFLRLKEISKELLNELINESKAFLNKSMSLLTLSTIILGFVPSVVLSLELLLSEKFMFMYMIFAILVSTVLIIVFPERPYVLKISLNNEERIGKVVTYAFMALLLFINSLVITNFVSVNMKQLILIDVSLLIPITIMRIRPFIMGFKEIKVVPSLILTVAEILQQSTDVVSDLRRAFIKTKVPSLSRLGVFNDVSELTNMLKYLKSWIARYAVLNIYLILNAGINDRATLIRLRDVVNEFISVYKEFLLSALLPLMLSIFIPWFCLSMMYLMKTVLSINYLLPIITLCVLYSVLASKFVFDDYVNPAFLVTSLMTVYMLI